MKSRLSIILSLLFLVPAALHAANWTHWRGPNFNGSSPETNLPQSFSATENVAWSLDMPGVSAATPIIYEDRVFLSSSDERNGELLAMAVDRETGKVEWKRAVNRGDIRRDDRSTYAASSPTTDGNRVIYFYGNGDLVGYDMKGEELWRRNIQDDYGEFAFQWTFSSSPLLYDGKLYLQVLQRNEPVRGRGKDGAESFLLAMAPSTGKTLWKSVRPSNASRESLEAFTSPVPYTHDGREEILIAGGDCLTGHDPETGKELWRWGTWNPSRIGHWRLVPSPVAGDGVILACAPKGEPIYAVKAGLNGTHEETALAWTSDDARILSSDVPTPLFYDGDFFVLNDVRRDTALSRIDPKTAEIKWSVELPRFAKYRSSPTGADGKIYFMNHDGQAFVVNAADGKILNTADLGNQGESNRSSVAIANGNLFIRTEKKLYCIGD